MTLASGREGRSFLNGVADGGRLGRLIASRVDLTRWSPPGRSDG